MTAPELLPCPFCGGEASHNGGGGSSYGRFWWIVGCKTCDIWVSDPEIWDKKNPGMLDPAYPAKWCLAAWNRRTPSPEVAALIAEARREGAKLLLDAYKGMLVLRRILYKAGLVEGGSAADQIAKRIVDAHPEFPGLASLRALKEPPPND